MSAPVTPHMKVLSVSLQQIDFNCLRRFMMHVRGCPLAESRIALQSEVVGNWVEHLRHTLICELLLETPKNSMFHLFLYFILFKFICYLFIC